MATAPSLPTSESTGPSALAERNLRFYEPLWRSSRLSSPESFNTWPLVKERLAKLAPDDRRLEVAPGLRPRLPLGGTEFVDLSEAAVAKLRAAGATARVGVAQDLPFADAHFAFVAAFDVLEHVDDDGALLVELARVTARGGTLLLSAPLHPERWTAFDQLCGHEQRYRPEDLVAKLAAAGFRVAASAPYGMGPQSSKLLDYAVAKLEQNWERAVWWYDRVFLPLGARWQRRLRLTDGMLDASALDEVLLVTERA